MFANGEQGADPQRSTGQPGGGFEAVESADGGQSIRLKEAGGGVSTVWADELTHDA